jgi:DNA-directed RNA polymerase subunit RPC12/RpoP
MKEDIEAIAELYGGISFMELIGNRGDSIKCPECGYVDPHFDLGCFTQHNSSYVCPNCDTIYEIKEKEG